MDWPQMNVSLMPMEMVSELYNYRLAPNDRALDANGNARRSRGVDWPEMTGSLMPIMEMLTGLKWSPP